MDKFDRMYLDLIAALTTIFIFSGCILLFFFTLADVASGPAVQSASSSASVQAPNTLLYASQPQPQGPRAHQSNRAGLEFSIAGVEQ